MNFVKNLLFWLVAIIVFVVVLLGTVDNSAPVALTFLDWSTPEVPISWWVFISFILGVLVTALANIWTNTRLRLRARKANKQVSRANTDLDKAKAESQSVSELPQN